MAKEILVIRDEQFAVFRKVLLERRHATLAARCRDAFPLQTARLSEDDLRRLMRPGVVGAARHGLVFDGHVVGYVGLMLTVGEDFEDNPACAWVVDLLDDDSLPPDARLARVAVRLQERPSAR